MQSARCIHRRFCDDLNAGYRWTVLAEARCGGWLHFRPDDQGLLQPADRESWAANLTEGSSRMGPEFRRNRDSWVEDGRVRPLSSQELEALKVGPKPELQQADYFAEELEADC